MFCSGKDLDSLCRTVSSELNILSDWFAVNKLSLNIAKTSFMIFSRGHGGRVVTLSPPTSEAGVRSRHGLKWESW